MAHKHRNVCDFRQDKEGRDWGIPVYFNDDNAQMLWKTARPPSPYWEGGAVWDSILNKREWLDRHGWLQLPNWLQKPRQNHEWRLLQMEPDAHAWDNVTGTYSPISRLAEHIVVWHEDDVHVATHHDQRAARTMRDHLSRYKRRYFIEVRQVCCRHNCMI